MGTGDKIREKTSEWEKKTTKATDKAKANIDAGVKKIKSKIDKASK